jgi:hypothetical protein
MAVNTNDDTSARLAVEAGGSELPYEAASKTQSAATVVGDAETDEADASREAALVRVRDGVPVFVADRLRVLVGDVVRVGVFVDVGESLTVPLLDRLSEPLREGVKLGLDPGERLPVGVCVTLELTLGGAERVGVPVPVGDTVFVGEGESLVV